MSHLAFPDKPMTSTEMRAIQKANEGIRTYRIVCKVDETYEVEARTPTEALAAHDRGESALVGCWSFDSCDVEVVEP